MHLFYMNLRKMYLQYNEFILQLLEAYYTNKNKTEVIVREFII